MKLLALGNQYQLWDHYISDGNDVFVMLPMLLQVPSSYLEV